MNKTIEPPTAKPAGDVVLQEVWRAKDTLSAQYGHDLAKLFAETRQREQLSGHPLVEPPKRPKVMKADSKGHPATKLGRKRA